MNATDHLKATALTAILTMTCFVPLSTHGYQDPDDDFQDESRQIFRVYEKSRPKAKTTKKKRPAPRYVDKTSKAAPKSGEANPTPKPDTVESVLAGVTLWELRPSKSTDAAETRLLVQEEDDDPRSKELTPVRVEADTPLAAGDRVRLTIESPRDGYLYVIDREIYGDGTTSDPYLIFPTLRTRSGNNEVRGGLLVDIPTQEDRPNYFTLKPSRKDQTSEQLTIIVSPKPLDLPPLGRSAMKLTQEQFDTWKAMEVPAEHFELEGGAGQSWTVAEKQAGAAKAGEESLLDSEDPLPQTIYRVTIKPGTPLVFTVSLNIAR